MSAVGYLMRLPPSGDQLILTAEQLNTVMAALGPNPRILREAHVGEGLGDHGYKNSDVWEVHTPHLHEMQITAPAVSEQWLAAVELAQKVRGVDGHNPF